MAYGVSKSMNNSNTELSELTLANIEALAQCEGGGEYYDEGGFFDGVSEVFGYDYLPRVEQVKDYSFTFSCGVDIGAILNGVNMGIESYGTIDYSVFVPGVYKIACKSGPYEYCQERVFRM